MPIAIKMMKDVGREDNIEKEKKRARLILIICHVIFYSMTIAWFVASIITGDFIVRFSITGVFLF